MKRSLHVMATLAVCLLSLPTSACTHHDTFAAISPADAAENMVHDQAAGTAHEGEQAAVVIMYVHALDKAIVASDSTRAEAFKNAHQQKTCVDQAVEQQFARTMLERVTSILTADPQRLRGWMAYVKATSSMAALPPEVDACNVITSA